MKEKYCLKDYYEESSTGKICIWISIISMSVVLFFKNLQKSVFCRKIIKKQIAYLNSDEISKGNFKEIEEIPLKILVEKRKELFKNFQLLLLENPEKLTCFIDLKLFKKNRLFLDEIMSEVLNFSKQNLIIATLKIIGSNKSRLKKNKTIEYITEKLSEEKKEHYLKHFQNAFSEMGIKTKNK